MDELKDPRGEIERSRRDPRLGHGREAMISDWRSAIESAERVRRISRWGLQALKWSVEIEKIRGGDPLPASRLRAARERAALAKAESDNQTVEVNAMTLISIMSATDALVEELVPQAHEMLLELGARKLVDDFVRQRAAMQADQPGPAPDLPESSLEEVRAVMLAAIREESGTVNGSVRGAGIKRWERPLREIGLQAPKGRPIPNAMAVALAEMIQLRHVLVHRAGRVNADALRKAPSLPYQDGELVRVDGDAYRRYCAALCTYGEEILRRMGFGEADLDNWAGNTPIND